MSKSPSEISLKLVGDERLKGHAALSDFRQVVSSLDRCIRIVERAVGTSARTLEYPIVKLASASALLAVRPMSTRKVDEAGKKVALLFDETVQALENGHSVDARLSLDDLKSFRRLILPLSRGAERIEINGRPVTKRLAETVDRLEGTTYPQHGSVRGKIEGVSLHEKLEFHLYPAAGGVCVTCRFDDSQRRQVLASIDRYVTVWGKLHFRAHRPWPERVTEVGRIDVRERDEELPRLQDLIGFAPDLTGDLSTAEFMRNIRDE